MEPSKGMAHRRCFDDSVMLSRETPVAGPLLLIGQFKWFGWGVWANQNSEDTHVQDKPGRDDESASPTVASDELIGHKRIDKGSQSSPGQAHSHGNRAVVLEVNDDCHHAGRVDEAEPGTC